MKRINSRGMSQANKHVLMGADLQPEKIPEVYYPQNSPQHSNHEPSKREVWVWRYLLATASPVQI
jgi:hypothetical protein